ncbi:carbonic anhydrase [Atractiella rhizophila]|nr:carbonic anhydrase [Atractiella rhizophila]
MDLQTLLNRNDSFASHYDPVLRDTLAKGQSPKVFWLGCSDSRVPESIITGAQPGDIFVHRNIANSFHAFDKSALAALAYAVNHLGVEHIVVCGHSSCGGCLASLSAAQQGDEHYALHKRRHKPEEDGDAAISQWLEPIVNLAREKVLPHSNSEAVDALQTHALLDRLVEEHVRKTVADIKASSLLKAAGDKGKNVDVAGWVYELRTGKLNPVC